MKKDGLWSVKWLQSNKNIFADKIWGNHEPTRMAFMHFCERVRWYKQLRVYYTSLQNQIADLFQPLRQTHFERLVSFFIFSKRCFRVGAYRAATRCKNASVYVHVNLYSGVNPGVVSGALMDLSLSASDVSGQARDVSCWQVQVGRCLGRRPGSQRFQASFSSGMSADTSTSANSRWSEGDRAGVMRAVPSE